MRGVLHVVREGDDLVVVVVAGGVQLGERGAQQAGRPRAQDDEGFPRPAVRTVPAELPARALGAPAGDHGVGTEDGSEAILAATGAGIVVAAREIAAPAADPKLPPPDVPWRRFTGSQREEVAHVHVPREEAVVEDAQVLADPGLRRVLYTAPARDVVLATLNEGQVNGVLVGTEVVGVADAVGRCALAAVPVRIRRRGLLRRARRGACHMLH